MGVSSQGRGLSWQHHEPLGFRRRSDMFRLVFQECVFEFREEHVRKGSRLSQGEPVGS